jgi:hypothetical protein
MDPEFRQYVCCGLVLRSFSPVHHAVAVHSESDSRLAMLDNVQRSIEVLWRIELAYALIPGIKIRCNRKIGVPSVKHSINIWPHSGLAAVATKEHIQLDDQQTGSL